jgi:hypothetical protein
MRKMKELLTATRMGTLLGCPRRHFWRYELGLKAVVEAQALRFGTAWHAAMQARWSGDGYERALAAACGPGTCDEIQVATLAGMLAGYFAHYKAEIVHELHAEIEFRHAIAGSRSFDSAGKLDGLGHLADGRLVLLEHKTTADSVEAGSDYWTLLRLNPQIMQYVIAARECGWDVGTILYDVARKPSISPLSAVPVLDAEGRRIVVDAATGERVFKKDGAPRESADKEKGFVLKSEPESCEQYADRLRADTLARPEFYFARAEVPVLEADLEEFKVQRFELGKLILSLRRAEKRTSRREYAWPRNLGRTTCQSCEFAGFCLQGVAADAEHVPAGFRVGAVHGELAGSL